MKNVTLTKRWHANTLSHHRVELINQATYAGKLIYTATDDDGGDAVENTVNLLKEYLKSYNCRRCEKLI